VKESEDKQEHGLAYDVVMKMIGLFCFQGYHFYIGNFYTSANLFNDLEFMPVGCRVVILSDVKIISVDEAFYVAWVITGIQLFQMNLKLKCKYRKLCSQLNSPEAATYIEMMMC